MKISIDQGTTSTRAILYDNLNNVVDMSQKEVTLFTPQEGFVEQDALEILRTVYFCVTDVLKRNNLTLNQIEYISIANQRESVVAWNYKTGEPLYNCLVWQSLQSEDYCYALKAHEKTIRDKTGLIVDPYFSATKIMWLRDNIGFDKNTRVGTIDSWIIYNLTNKKEHLTDYSNASRTMLFDIHNLVWDDELLALMNLDKNLLPQVIDSNGNFGECQIEGFGSTSIRGVLGDQQAALYGHNCLSENTTKVTYGTGCFILTNIGLNHQIAVPEGTLKTIAWGIDGKITYALEASIFIGGSLIKWLRDNLKIIENVEETDKISQRQTNLHFIPTFQGIKTPIWNKDVRGALYGMDLSTDQNDIVKAAVEAIGMQVAYIIRAINQNTKVLKVDGGVTQNQYLMQFQADILQSVIAISNQVEVTAYGVMNLIANVPKDESLKEIKPQLSNKKALSLYKEWVRAYEHTIAFYKN